MREMSLAICMSGLGQVCTMVLMQCSPIKSFCRTFFCLFIFKGKDSFKIKGKVCCHHVKLKSGIWGTQRQEKAKRNLDKLCNEVMYLYVTV